MRLGRPPFSSQTPRSAMPRAQLWTHTPGVYITRECAGPRTVHVAPSCPDLMQRPEPWRVEDYELHKQLYKGKASLLYKAVCKVSGMSVAMKLYRKARLSQLNWYQVQREIRIHSQLQHPHIVAFYAAFEDSEHVYLALEYAAGGDLYEELKRRGGCLSEEKVARDILGPCLSAVGYLHQKGFIWRDCKPENILVSGKGRGRVMLADFGLSIDATEERPVTRAGTLDYMAPEVVMCPEKSHPQENKEKALLGYTQAVDAWALGVLVYELIVGHPPFERETRTDTYEQIMYRRPHYPANLSEAPRSFISAALTKSARKRPSVEELLGHPWVAMPRGPSLQPAVSDGASQQAVQLPPPQLGALATQALKNYASLKEAKGAPVYTITVDASLHGHQLQQAASAAQHVSNEGQRVIPDLGSTSSSQQEAAKQADAASSQESSLHTLIQWAGSSVQRLSSRLLSNGLSAPESTPSLLHSADANHVEEDATLRPEVLSEADTRRSSSSSEGSLAALFYPPLPHEKTAASNAAMPWSDTRRSGTVEPPGTASPPPEAGQALDDSIGAHHGSMSPDVVPADKAALAKALRPQRNVSEDIQGDKTPEKLPQWQRQDSNASLMDTPEPRPLVKFPSQRAGRQSGTARALSFWSPQPDVLNLE